MASVREICLVVPEDLKLAASMKSEKEELPLEPRRLRRRVRVSVFLIISEGHMFMTLVFYFVRKGFRLMVASIFAKKEFENGHIFGRTHQVRLFFYNPH